MSTKLPLERPNAYVSTTNACKLCMPLGACLAFRGIQGAITLLHGSQGCSTYVRRYLISHFREPVDIASSNFHESAAIFGGQRNLHTALDNVISGYQPAMVGIATTCLSETIGDDVPSLLHAYRKARPDSDLPALVHVSTPAYDGTHADGFAASVRAVLQQAARTDLPGPDLALLSAMLSPADLRHLKEIYEGFGLDTVLVPDYSETLDGETWLDYRRVAPGGTPLSEVARTGAARCAVELGTCLPAMGQSLAELGLEHHRQAIPVGIRASDAFFARLERLSGRNTPERYRAERGRLVDAYVDAHKYAYGKRAIVYGEPDLVVALAAFLTEIGITPAVCATGARVPRLREHLEQAIGEPLSNEVACWDRADFSDIERAVPELEPDLLVGSSKGYACAREHSIPLVRVGFPIHDRVGAARMLSVAYRGTQRLFDAVINTLLEAKQSASPVGFSYL